MATDGSPCVALNGKQFNLGVAQRLDINLKIPSGSGAYPLLAQGEGLKMRTGLILTTDGATVPTLSENGDHPLGAVTYAQEFQLQAKTDLVKKKVDRQLTVNLEGDMEKYVWTINGKAWPNNKPLKVKEGERVELSFVNNTSMSHPMHLHGHVFQVTKINGIKLNGPFRDTILVLPHSTVSVQFDANNPGNWPLHCHNLYHQFAGMMTTLDYEGFKGPTFTKAEKEQEFKQ